MGIINREEDKTLPEHTNEVERPMKMIRTSCLLLITLLFFPVSCHAWGAEKNEAMFEALASCDFHARREPEANYRVVEVPEGARVKVFGEQDGWYWIWYKNNMGWAKKEWLWAFRSLNAAKYTIPGYEPETGAVTLGETQWISTENFSGVEAAPGTVLTAQAADTAYTLRLWRGKKTLARSAGEWTPFTSWQDARPGDLIGGFTTYYDLLLGEPLHAERQHNIALGCSLLNGTTVQPGERFSFNARCGPYKFEKGYKRAPNVSETGAGYGGGVCQVTTTLYNAVMGLPLQITEWSPHGSKGVPYVPVALDASVWKTGDFRFINTLDYPIRIWAQPQSGVITVLIYRAL